MNVDKVQNTPNFGIKYSNKNAWAPRVLKAFESSDLLKSLDKKYPDASIRYTKLSGEDGIGNSEFIHTLIMDIKLAKGKIFRWNISSHRENVPEQLLINDLETMKLEDVERHVQPILKPMETISVEYKKENPIKAFFKNIFS